MVADGQTNRQGFRPIYTVKGLSSGKSLYVNRQLGWLYGLLEIEDSCLYLQRMEICVYDKASRKDSTLIYHTDALKTLFASYYENGRIPARWFSGELRAGKGDLVHYVHSGFTVIWKPNR